MNTSSVPHSVVDSDSVPSTSTVSFGSPVVPVSSGSRMVSILALCLGIASFFFAQGVVVPLAAVILGAFGLRDEPAGRGLATWGIVLAIVATFGWVVVLVVGALFALPTFLGLGLAGLF